MKNLEIVKVETKGTGFGPRGEATMHIYIRPDIPAEDVGLMVELYAHRSRFPSYSDPLSDVMSVASAGSGTIHVSYHPRYSNPEYPEQIKMLNADELIGALKPYIDALEAFNRKYAEVKPIYQIFRNYCGKARLYRYLTTDDKWLFRMEMNYTELPDFDEAKENYDTGYASQDFIFSNEDAKTITEEMVEDFVSSVFEAVRTDYKIRTAKNAFRKMCRDCEGTNDFQIEIEPTKATITHYRAKDMWHEIMANNIDELVLTLSGLNCGLLRQIGINWKIIDTPEEAAKKAAKAAESEVYYKQREAARKKEIRETRQKIEADWNALKAALSPPKPLN